MLSTLSHKFSRAKAVLQHQLELVSHFKHLPRLTLEDEKIAAGLKKDGVYVTRLAALGIASTDRLLEAADRHLRDMKVLLAETLESQAAERQATGSQATFGSVENPAYPQIFTMTDLPEFYQWGREPRLLNIVENYVGVPVIFQGVHLRRDFANENPVTTEFWHRDLEDWRMVKIFVYLTDATDDFGPLEYIPKSKVSYLTARRILTETGRSRRMGLTDQEMEQIIPRSEWKSCSVPAGSVVFADPVSIFHHGKSRRQERSALFFVYTAARPLRPECVLQYSDDTFAHPEAIPQQTVRR